MISEGGTGENRSSTNSETTMAHINETKTFSVNKVLTLEMKALLDRITLDWELIWLKNLPNPMKAGRSEEPKMNNQNKSFKGEAEKKNPWNQS